MLKPSRRTETRKKILIILLTLAALLALWNACPMKSLLHFFHRGEAYSSGIARAFSAALDLISIQLGRRPVLGVAPADGTGLNIS